MTESHAKAAIYLIQSIPFLVLGIIALIYTLPAFFVLLVFTGSMVYGIITSAYRREWHAEHLVQSHIGR